MPISLFGRAPAGASHTAEVRFSIPTGLCHPAQGCEERATLGQPANNFSYPNGVASVFRRNVLQPWAMSYNPFGIGRTTRRIVALFMMISLACFA